MTEPDCLLCSVVRGELPARVVLNGDNAMGIVNDREPLSRGHLVFFPRRHVARLDRMTDEELAEVLSGLRRAAGALGTESYNLLQNNGGLAGQTVFHAHFHLIPKWSESEGLRYERPAHRHFDHDEVFARVKSAFSRPS